MAAEQARAHGGRWVTGHVLGGSEGGFEFEGFNQRLRAGRNGEGMQARYVVLDYSGMGTSLYSTHSLDAAHTDSKTGGLKYLGRSIHFAGSTPYRDTSCWFSPHFACGGGECGPTVGRCQRVLSLCLNSSSSLRHGLGHLLLRPAPVGLAGRCCRQRLPPF